MRAVVQRVSSARVDVENKETGSIGRGLMVLLGVENGDTEKDASWIADRIANMRIFNDRAGKMNLSVMDTGGSVLAVSQFTLLGDCRRGRRPGFSDAAPPEEAESLYLKVMAMLREFGICVESGIFRASMNVYLCNEGPVTILLDSRKKF